MTSRPPSAQSSVAIVDLPMPEAPTKATAASPTCTALAWRTVSPRMVSTKARRVPLTSTDTTPGSAPRIGCTTARVRVRLSATSQVPKNRSRKPRSSAVAA